jgi:Ribonuclease G/E
VLRLKGEGGLVVIDLAGRGHDGPALISGARLAFGPDNPGVAFGPISRFGTLELTVPRRRRSLADRLLGPDGQPTALTLALRLIRQIEREAQADAGAQLEIRAAPDVAEAAAPYLSALTDRFGGRLAIVADAARARGDSDIKAR